MSAGTGRPAAQYTRRRTIRACLTCRTRKSRCDGARPQCSFCAISGSACNYQESESYKLDVGSVQILERIGSMEDSILQTLQRMSLGSSVGPDPTHNRQHHGLLWLNGDVVMTWPPLLQLLREGEDALLLRAFASELRSCCTHHGPAPPDFPTSPVVLESLPGCLESTEPMQLVSAPGFAIAQLTEAQASLRTDTAVAHLRHYVTHIHSKSPILDLEWLRQLQAYAAEGRIDPLSPILAQLPAGVDPSDVAILLLAVALGAICRVQPAHEPLPPSPYVRLALPWLGLASFAPHDMVKSLQAQLLLSSYHMWNMKHLDAWMLVDSFSSKAEKLLVKQHDVVQDGHNHRVLWAVAKMHLELSEECQIGYPSLNKGRLIRLVMSTSLPKPPAHEFSWPEVSRSLHHDTWYYYLAETSSRRLIERIKDELYSDFGGTGPMDCLATALPIAYELDRQVEEWMDSLPDNFQPTPFRREMGPSPGLSASPVGTQWARLGMRTVLRNRMWQMHMLIFRPFLSEVLARQASRGHAGPGQDPPTGLPPTLLRGAVKSLSYATSFLLEQPQTVRRHYGSWLLARNAWTAGLSCIAALSDPSIRAHLPDGDTAANGDSNGTACRPAGDLGAPLRTDIMEAVRRAHSILWQWRHESPSLAACGRVLSHLAVKMAEEIGARGMDPGFSME